MKLQTTKHKKNKGKKGRKLTPEQKFQRAWKRVLKAKQRNENLKQEVHHFANEITQQIESEEECYTRALYLNTEQLIRFFTRKSLLQWERHELYDWISGNIEELSHHPFFSHLNIPALHDCFIEAMPIPSLLDDEFLPLFDDLGDDGGTQQTQVDENIDMFETFADIGDDEDDEVTNEDDPFQNFYDKIFEDQQAQTEQRKQEVQALDQVLKASSINKMFRKIAARLHPDREQDPDKQAEKHQQMSELIEARNQRDVLILFTLYEEHVGEPFDQLIDADHERLTILLTHQLTMLEEEREQLIDDDAKAGMIFRRFHFATKSKVQAEVRQHLKSLRTSTCQVEGFISDVTSLKKLKPHLDERYQKEGLLANLLDDMPFVIMD